MGDFNPSFPSTISNLTGWYTGDSALMSGTAMTQWTDLSGNGNHVTGSDLVGTIQRVSTDGGITGGPRPFLYGGTSERLKFSTSVMTGTSSDYTLFHVSRYYAGSTPTVYAFDDQLTTTTFTGSLSGNSNNGPATRITSSAANGGYIEMCHAGTNRVGTVSWQLTMGDAWEVDAEIYINPINYGGADDIRFIYYATFPITTSDSAMGTDGHGGHYIRWEYYDGDTVEMRNSSDSVLQSVATTLSMNQWMPIKVTYNNGAFTAVIKDASGGIINTTTRSYSTTFSSYHNTPKYFGFAGRSGGVEARDRIRNITFKSLVPTPVRKRIYDGIGTNWLSGFHDGNTGLAYHNGWVGASSGDLHGNDWVFSTDQRSLYRSNGVTRGTAGGNLSAQLTVNYGASQSSESSTWGIAEIIVYGRTLSSAEYLSVENYLNLKYRLPLDLQTIGLAAGDTAPHSLSELYNQSFKDGSSTPASGMISIGTFLDKTIGAASPEGQQVFTTSGTFTIPAGVTSISVVCIGGGGGSSGCSGASEYSGGGGGGGGLAYGTFPVTAGSSVTVQVGAAGLPGTNVNSSTNIAGTGGQSSVSYNGSTKIYADGGIGGRYPT